MKVTVRCPYCEGRFRMNTSVWDDFKLEQGVCKLCGNSFFYVAVSPSTTATYRIEFLKGDKTYI